MKIMRYFFLKKLKDTIDWFFFLSRNNFRKDEWYFVLNDAIGDTYIICSFLPFIINNGHKVNVIISKENQKFIPYLFSDKINILDIDVPINLLVKFGQYKKGIPILVHPKYHLNALLFNIIGYKNINIYDVFKLFVNVPFSIGPFRPTFLFDFRQEIDNLFQAKKLVRGNTVLVCPDANSIEGFDISLWTLICKKLVSVGYSVVFMSNRKVNAEFEVINFPLNYSKSFCDTAGYLVSIRSGFCDLIATSTAKKVILYPDIMWYNGSLLEVSSLRYHGLNDEYLLELQIELSVESLSDKIVEFFKK